MIWSREGSPAIIDAAARARPRWPICIEDLPDARARAPYALTVSPYRRPPPGRGALEAKAACHYPNNGRIVREARARGFHNALSLDRRATSPRPPRPTSSWSATAWCRRRSPNGTFLAGITRARVIGLLRADGVEVRRGAR